MLQPSKQTSSPWTRVRDELRRSPVFVRGSREVSLREDGLRRADLGGDAIHPAWCACRSCLQRDGVAYTRHRRKLQVWAVLFIGVAAALYGFVFASLPQIAGAFGWTQTISAPVEHVGSER